MLAARWPRAGHLLLTCSPLEAPEGATHSPQPLSPLPHSLLSLATSSPSSAPSSSLPEWSSSMPLAVAVATEPPSPS